MKQHLYRVTKQSAERRELNNGAGEALARAFELALTPTIMGGLGWLLDSWLGTGPWLFIFLFLFTFCYLVWKFAHNYDLEMREHERKMFAPSAEKETFSAESTAPASGRHERTVPIDRRSRIDRSGRAT